MIKKLLDTIFPDDEKLVMGNRDMKWKWGIIEILCVALIVAFLGFVGYVWLTK